MSDEALTMLLTEEEAPLSEDEWALIPEVFRPSPGCDYQPRVIVPYRPEMGCPPLFEAMLIAQRANPQAPSFPSPLIANEDYGSISDITVALLPRWTRREPVALSEALPSGERRPYRALRVRLEPAEDRTLARVDRIGGSARLEDGDNYATALQLHRLIEVGDGDDLMICLWESEGWEFEDEDEPDRGPMSGTFHIRPS